MGEHEDDIESQVIDLTDVDLDRLLADKDSVLGLALSRMRTEATAVDSAIMYFQQSI
jgi:FXSXX-COOH protein